MRRRRVRPSGLPMGPLHQSTLGVGTAIVMLLGGCTDLQQLSAGPAVAIVDRRASWGGAVVGESVIGVTSPTGGFTGVGAGARGMVTERVIDVAPFVATHLGRSIDNTFLDGSVRIGPGVQLLDGRPLAFGSVGGSIGVGYAISDTGWRHQQPWFNPWAVEAHPMPLGGPDVLGLQHGDDARDHGTRERSRVLLTFSLATDLDARFTRSPMLSLSALVGVAWLDEVSSH